MRYLFFHEAGVLADLQGIACFKVQSCPEGTEVVLASQACYSQLFVGPEQEADAFLAALARQLDAVPVGAQAQGSDDDARRPDGITDKYLVRKADGSPTDPAACYFVLRYDTDPHARVALYAYANSVSHDKPRLAGDLLAALTATAPARRERPAAPEQTPAADPASLVSSQDATS